MQPCLIPHELCLLTPGTAPCLIVVLVTLLSSSSHQTVVWVGVEPDALLGSSSVMKSRVKIATTALSSTINLLIPLASPSPFDVSIRHSTFSSCIKHTFCTVGDSVAVILVFSLLLSGPAEAFTSAKMYGLMTLVGMGYWVFLIVLVWCSFLFYYSWKRWISEKNGNGLLRGCVPRMKSCNSGTKCAC